MSDAPKAPALDPELVRTFVIAGHRDLEQVKAMLAEQPTLINATWDWGDGDFETALGGAAHVGQREIAEYLLAQGAHMTIYAAAMLGQLEVVQAIIQAQPDAHTYPGAHGIPLKDHAQQGGEPASAVLAYLDSLS